MHVVLRFLLIWVAARSSVDGSTSMAGAGLATEAELNGMAAGCSVDMLG